ncbi:puratrophin-1-like [Phascolarctos cinereus]
MRSKRMWVVLVRGAGGGEPCWSGETLKWRGTQGGSNYFLELEREDVLPALRRQQARIFGNLEKLRDFHCHFFLRELESCSQQPVWVAHTFPALSAPGSAAPSLDGAVTTPPSPVLAARRASPFLPDEPLLVTALLLVSSCGRDSWGLAGVTSGRARGGASRGASTASRGLSLTSPQREEFGMYAYYSKNKPTSDALWASHGKAFFKDKQHRLRDRLDLSSYLLKPIQWMSEYVLLLQELRRACNYRPARSSFRESDLAALCTACDLVRFQLLHGSDLLVMDAICDCDVSVPGHGTGRPCTAWPPGLALGAQACSRPQKAPATGARPIGVGWQRREAQSELGPVLWAQGVWGAPAERRRLCQVNLKEQGQLACQDEFVVWSGGKKCQRHVFLFEELILFSKSQHCPKGHEVFLYKHSFKTADIGFTDSYGESGLCFEIWFRRRKANDTFVLQALTPKIKLAWTANIASLLWRRAKRNKGSKPFLDITPREVATDDLAIRTGAQTQASLAVSLFDHTNPSLGSPAAFPSGPSSSSSLEPVNLHLCRDLAALGLCWPSGPTAYLEERDPETKMAGQEGPEAWGAGDGGGLRWWTRAWTLQEGGRGRVPLRSPCPRSGPLSPSGR